MTRAASGGKTGSQKSAALPPVTGYFQRAELPLHSLVFLAPFLALFEIGTYFHPSDPIAFRRLQIFFQLLGASGRFLPALAVVGILLAWHIARGDRWHVEWGTIIGMMLESALVAMPLLALGIAFARWQAHIPLAAAADIWRDKTVLSLGAGIYEELVFRLMLMTLLVLVFADVLKFAPTVTSLLMVLISAVLFSLYHYLGYEAFTVQSFVFRTLAGIYFGGLFLTRGFGVTAGCHICYDVFLVGLSALAVHS